MSCESCKGGQRGFEDPSYRCSSCTVSPKRHAYHRAPKPAVDIFEHLCYDVVKSTKENSVSSIIDLSDYGQPVAGDVVEAKFPPTAEQQAAIDAFNTGESVALSAYAATGKSTTLRSMAESAPDRRGCYVGFNKSVADEARETFPETVQCKTAHALAYATVGRAYQHRLGGNRMAPWDVAKKLKIFSPFRVCPDVVLSPMALASLVMATVERFCQSDQDEVQRYNVPTVKGGEEYREKIRDRVVPLARKAWEDIASLDGVLPFSHNHYLAIWAMGNPKLNMSYVLCDEAQDLSARFESVLKRQSIQVVLVGDSFQSLYRWNGAVNTMERFGAKHQLTITQSFRFGDVIAEQANIFLRMLGAELPLRGLASIDSKLDRVAIPDAVLCRSNAGAIEEVINLQEQGVPVAFCGGTKEIESFAKGAEALMRGKQTLHPDLFAFPTWESVEAYSKTPEGRDLQVLVRLVSLHGPDALRRVASATVPEKQAQTVVSTVHKAKGRQWGSVRIANDFRIPTEIDDAPLTPEELMIMYVAVTRAQFVLDRGPLAFVDGLV